MMSQVVDGQMDLSIDDKTNHVVNNNNNNAPIGRLMPDVPQHQMSSGPGRRSPSQYDDPNQAMLPMQQQPQQMQQMPGQPNYLLPPRTTFVTTSAVPTVVSGDYHIASFSKPTPTTSYVQTGPVVYVVSPPPARSPPMILTQPQQPVLMQPFQMPATTTVAMPPMTIFPGTAMPISPTLDAQSSSFTNTFLRGILSSIDSKDPVVANAWLETLLDAIDLLPADIIQREIVVIAVNKAQIEQSTNSRKAACRLLAKISSKLDSQSVRQEILPIASALCQDAESEVRHCMCCHLGYVAHGVGGSDVVESSILPQLVDLANDENADVRLAAVEAVVNLLPLITVEVIGRTVVPLMMKSCERAKHLEDETLPKMTHLLGPMCHGLQNHLNAEQKSWFLGFYRHLAQLGLSPSRDSSLRKGIKTGNEPQPMPDLLPMVEIDRSELYAECRLQCAFNFPAMIIFVGAGNFVELLYPIFSDLAADPSWRVRQTVARSLHEVAKLVGLGFKVTKLEVSNLFADPQTDVLEAMVTNMVHVIDALARHGVLQFAGQGGKYSHDLSRALLHCEETISLTRNWRLQADCLEKFSCLANCISPSTIMQRFIPMLFARIQKTRTLPCRVAAARTLLVILRFTVKVEDRSRIIYRIQCDLANGQSCHTRMLFLKLCDMAMALFSKQYFKRNFFETLLSLAKDRVPNVRLKLCGLLPRLKSLLSLPSDRGHLQRLEDTVKDLMLRETDRDVLFSIQKAIQDLDVVETGVDGVPSLNAEEDLDNERKLREERLIASMEDQLYSKSSNSDLSSTSSPTKHYLPVSTAGNGSDRLRYLTPSPPASSSTSPQSDSSNRKRSESLPPPLSRNGNPAPYGANGTSTSPSSSLTSLARQTPEPMRTYSSEMADYGVERRGYSTGLSNTWAPASRELNHQMPYSSSLENLDPSAKEFLVDAGVILDKSSMLNGSGNNHFSINMQSGISASLPNISSAASKNYHQNFHQHFSVGPADMGRAGNSVNVSGGPFEVDVDGNRLKRNLDGELSKYLISNEEMEQYEAEYQRCANALAAGNSDPAALLAGNGPRTSKLDVQLSPTRNRETGNNNNSNGGIFTPTDKLMSISSLAQTTFSKLTSTDKLQGSIERLAEKWEAKRRNMADEGTSGTIGVIDEPELNDGRSQRSSILEQNKLVAIKQQALPKRRSLLKPPAGPSSTATHSKLGTASAASVVASSTPKTILAKKRLSLTDHVGAVSQQAMQKLINRKSLNAGEVSMIGYEDKHQQQQQQQQDEGARRMNRLKGMRRFASVDDGKGDEDLSYLEYNTPQNDRPTNYRGVNSSPSRPGFKPREGGFYYGSPTLSPTHTGGRTLPQPPRSLPMTPGSGHQPPPRMSFIPSKPFNNLMQNDHHASLSNSAPASMPSPGPGRPTYPPASTSPAPQATTSYRQQPEPPRYNATAGGAPRRSGPSSLITSDPSPSTASKSKIVSPYIVAVDGSSQHFDFLSPTDSSNLPPHENSSNSSDSASSKFGRMQPTATRYRPSPTTAAPLQKRPVSATSGNGQQNNSNNNSNSRVTRLTGSHLKPQSGKSLSAESILNIDPYEPVDGGARYTRQATSGNFQRTSGNHSTTATTSYGRRSGDELQRKSSTESEPKAAAANGVRRSSGSRMWQGQMNGSTMRQRSQEGRSPSTSSSSLPTAAPTSTSTTANRNRSTRMSSQDSFDNGHPPHHPPPLTSRNSFTQQNGGSAAHQPRGGGGSGARSRPGSINSSPGSSRPTSPTNHHITGKQQQSQQQQQQQRRPLVSKNSLTSSNSNSSNSSYGPRTTTHQNNPAAGSTANQHSSGGGPSSRRTANNTASTSTAPQNSRTPTNAGSNGPSTGNGYSQNGRGGGTFSRQSSVGGIPPPGFASGSRATAARGGAKQ